MSMLFSILVLLLFVLAHGETPSYFCSKEFTERESKLGAPNEQFFLEHFDPNALYQVKPSNRYYVDKLLESLFSEEEETTLVFFGGSMVTGLGCEQEEFGLTHQECAYPARIQRILAEIVGNRKLKVVNKAVGGSTTGGYLPALPIVMQSSAKDVSAVFIDFSVNDAAEVQDWGGTTVGHQQATDVEHDAVTHATESFVRFLRSSYPDVPIFFVEGYPLSKGGHSFQAHKAIAEHYDIPLFSYRSAIPKQLATNNKLWGNVPHPAWYVHENVAYTVVKGLLSGVRDGCSNSSSSSTESVIPLNWDPPTLLTDGKLPAPLSSKADLDRFKVCSKPTSYFNAYDEYGKEQNPDISGDWSLFEDRPGKPGWIAESKGKVLEFNVVFGSNPRLYVGYLRSYEGLGTADFSMPRIKRDQIVPLDGIEKEQHASQTFDLVMNVKQKPFQADKNGIHGVLGWDMKPHTHTKARFVSTSDEKFKLMYVIAC